MLMFWLAKIVLAASSSPPGRLGRSRTGEGREDRASRTSKTGDSRDSSMEGTEIQGVGKRGGTF